MNKVLINASAVFLYIFNQSFLGAEITFEHFIQRIDFHVHYLERFNKIINKQPETRLKELTFQDIHFRNNLVQWAADTVEQEASLNALFEVWCLFLNHKGINKVVDEYFVLDYSKLLLLIDYQLLLHLQRITWTDIGLLYLQISALPLAEILDLLDEVREQLNLIMEKFPTEEQPSLSAWLASYWWVPPVIGTSVFFTYLKWYLLHYQGQLQHDNFPRPPHA